jgi:spermidine synthase
MGYLADMQFTMRCCILLNLAGVVLAGLSSGRAAVVFQTTSPYHHISVVDEDGLRTLSFDGSRETRMSLRNPLAGHFEYTEYFHLPWLWRPEMTNVLMIGLGGGSTQRAYQHYYPAVTVETVEIDPVVVQVASNFFNLKQSPKQQVHVEDGRVFLRRTKKQFDAIILDAYTANRYGSFIPYHLATKDFFALAAEHLPQDGVLAYNVMGSLHGWRADLLAAVYKTMKTVFPQVYLFPARDSQNVVMVGVKSTQPVALSQLEQRAAELVTKGRVTMPTFRARMRAFRAAPPPAVAQAPVLTDNFAPVEGLLSMGQ